MVVSAKHENLERISNFVFTSANEAGFNETAIFEIEMAVDEACSNIIDHAYEGDFNGEIECTCSVKENSFLVILHDNGHSFDPKQVPLPDLYCPLEERGEHGLGLYLMYKYMDEINFDFSDNTGNTLTMVKHKDS
jgi:serine/threonine-protein kinase RsbW